MLEMCRLFFPSITSIPDYVSSTYGHGIDAYKIQQMLDKRISVSDIAAALNISPHQIHDAVKTGKVFYPDYYGNTRKKPVEQCDNEWNVVACFQTIADAARSVNGDPSTLRAKLRKGPVFYKNYNWRYLNQYIA